MNIGKKKILKKLINEKNSIFDFIFISSMILVKEEYMDKQFIVITHGKFAEAYKE